MVVLTTKGRQPYFYARISTRVLYERTHFRAIIARTYKILAEGQVRTYFGPVIRSYYRYKTRHRNGPHTAQKAKDSYPYYAESGKNRFTVAPLGPARW